MLVTIANFLKKPRYTYFEAACLVSGAAFASSAIAYLVKQHVGCIRTYKWMLALSAFAGVARLYYRKEIEKKLSHLSQCEQYGWKIGIVACLALNEMTTISCFSKTAGKFATKVLRWFVVPLSTYFFVQAAYVIARALQEQWDRSPRPIKVKGLKKWQVNTGVTGMVILGAAKSEWIKNHPLYSLFIAALSCLVGYQQTGRKTMTLDQKPSSATVFCSIAIRDPEDILQIEREKRSAISHLAIRLLCPLRMADQVLPRCQMLYSGVKRLEVINTTGIRMDWDNKAFNEIPPQVCQLVLEGFSIDSDFITEARQKKEPLEIRFRKCTGRFNFPCNFREEKVVVSLATRLEEWEAYLSHGLFFPLRSF